MKKNEKEDAKVTVKKIKIVNILIVSIKDYSPTLTLTENIENLG